MPPRILFSAPHDFLADPGALWPHDGELELREAWHEDELPAGADIEGWVVNPGQHFVVDGTVLERFPRLAALVTPSTGSNHIDLQACLERGVAVRTLLDDREALEWISASAEFTFLLLLAALRRLEAGRRAVAAGSWRREEATLRGHELQGMTVGAVGLGRIGRRLARYTAAFDAALAYYDPYVEEPAGGPRRIATLDELFSACGAVVICCALTEETRGMVTGDLVRRLGHRAALVNTARGEVLDEAAVAAALRERSDLAFAADVVQGEVTGRHGSSPLVALAHEGRILLTPHIAGATVESQTRAAASALRLLREALDRRP